MPTMPKVNSFCRREGGQYVQDVASSLGLNNELVVV